MKRKIEKALRRAVEDLPRPDSGTLSQTPVRKMEVHDYVTWQDGPVRRGRGWFLPAALVLCALAVCLGVVVYLQFFQVYSVVDLRVNPSFAIQLDRRDQVRGIEALSQDAVPILEGRSYRGWTLEAALGALLDELTAKGYLSTSADQVDVAVNSKSAEHGRELRAVVEACIAGKLEGLPASAGPESSPSPVPATPEPVPTPPPAVTEPPSTPQMPGHGHQYGKMEHMPTPTPTPTPSPALLTEAEVEGLVLARVPKAVIKHIKLDEEHGQAIYEVEFRDGDGEKYEAEFDALTGDILKWEED